MSSARRGFSPVRPGRRVTRPGRASRNGRGRGFTLVELLVVIGIIALLISILIPVLGRARDQAQRIKCMNNERQLLLACHMYAVESRGAWPFCNWLSQEDGAAENNPGWLYQWPNLSQPQFVETGVLYPYLKTREVYHCPADPPPYDNGTTRWLTSYLMNGAVNGFGREQSGRPRIPWFKTSNFKATDICFWEAPEIEFWNDGSSFPSEGYTNRHGRPQSGSAGVLPVRGAAAGASVGCFDGHTEWMTIDDWAREVNTSTRSRLWCVPDTGNGR
jgi:prepilin-type N-terminal cleavage/methylation domain-containing protein